jgi:hypothetical protein
MRMLFDVVLVFLLFEKTCGEPLSNLPYWMMPHNKTLPTIGPGQSNSIWNHNGSPGSSITVQTVYYPLIIPHIGGIPIPKNEQWSIPYSSDMKYVVFHTEPETHEMTVKSANHSVTVCEMQVAHPTPNSQCAKYGAIRYFLTKNNNFIYTSDAKFCFWYNEESGLCCLNGWTKDTQVLQIKNLHCAGKYGAPACDC